MLYFRKTKPKNGHRHKKQLSNESSSTVGCKNIGIWVAIVTNICWLLILSYIVSVVHSQFAAMEKRFSDSLRSIPDEWHDKAHSLEQNQSTLFLKLFDLQQAAKNFTEDVVQLRSIVDQQQVQMRDFPQMALLEKDVADFGAQMGSFKSEIDSMKSRISKVSQTLREHDDSLEYIKKLNVTGSPANSTAINADIQQIRQELDLLSNTTSRISDTLARVNATLTSLATMEQQKVDELDKNHLRKINDLTDSVANITSHDVNVAMQNYQEKIMGLEENLGRMAKAVEGLAQTSKGPSDQISLPNKNSAPGLNDDDGHNIPTNILGKGDDGKAVPPVM